MRIHDLTRPISPGMPVYPGDPEVDFRREADLDRDGYRLASVRLGTHTGTHVDAPAHFLAQGGTVDALPLAALVGPARVVNPGDPMRVEPGERLLVRSGWSERWGTPDYFEAFPTLPEALVEELLRAPAALIGLETPSLDPDHERDSRLHRLLLGAGVVLIENLVGLVELPERVFLTALPLPLESLDGSPCRVVALELPLNLY